MNKPKRKYTLTAKALAANRRNLILANAVDASIRFRSTPKRLQASRANLTRALASLRAASLTPDGFPRKAEVRSQKLEAGKEETETGNQKSETGNSKLEERNSKFAGQEKSHLTPHSTATNHRSEIANPSSVAGHDVQRTLRPSDVLLRRVDHQWHDSPAYGTSYTRGLHAVSLRRSGRLAGEPGGAFDAHLQLFVKALAPQTAREQRLARGIAEVVWRRLRVFSGQARWERASLLYRLREAAHGPCPGTELDESLTVPRLAAGLAFEIDRIFSTDLDLNVPADKLNARLERLSRLWVVGRGGDPRLFELGTPARATDGALLERPPESMGNPLRPPGELAARLRYRTSCELAAFSPDRWAQGKPGSTSRLSLWEDPGDPATPAGLMLAQLEESAGEGSERLPGGSNIDSPEALEELWERAWERISQYGHTNSRVMVHGYTLPDATRRQLFVNAMPGRKTQSPNSGAAEAARGNAQAQPPTMCSQVIWPRLQLYAGVSQGEAGELGRLLTAQIGRRMRRELKARLGHIPGGAKLQPEHNDYTASFLMELILLFHRSNNASFEQRSALQPLNAALHEFLVDRFGVSEDFDLLNPTYAEKAWKASVETRRRVLADRLTKYEESKRALQHSGETAAQGVARAEGHLHDVEEMINLDCFVPDPEFDRLLDEPEDPVSAALRHLRPDPEWVTRYRAAASCRMLPLRGWKFESHARCRARVGLGKKRLKVKKG